MSLFFSRLFLLLSFVLLLELAQAQESTPAIYKGKIYVMSSDGYVHAIK